MPLDPDDLFCAMAWGRIVRYVRRLYPRFQPETADDVAQEAILRYLRYRRHREAPNPMALVYRIARWAAANEYRRLQKKSHTSLDSGGPDGQPIDLPTPPAGIPAEKFEVMVLCIFEWIREERSDDLPIFELRLAGRTYEEIAAALGSTSQAVRQRFSRCCKAIRSHKDALGIDVLMDEWLSGREGA